MATDSMYFGRPGFLFEIPHPRGGADTTRIRPTAVFPTAAGAARVGRMLEGRRPVQLQWERLLYETYASIEAVAQGHEGGGPFALIDPSRINYLTVNQSAATSLSNSTDNFTIAGSGCTISSTASTYDRGPRSLQWNFTFAASGDLTLDSPSTTWPGIPVVAGVQLTFSVYHKGGGTDAVMTVVPALEWLDSTGTLISTTSGAGGTSSSSAFAATSVSGTPPSTAYWVRCHVTVSSGMSAGSILYLDRFQLERGASATTWRPGTGVMPVGVVGFTDGWPWQAADYREGPTLTLQEVS